TSKAEKPLAEQLRQQLAELLREITGSPQRADDLRGYILGSVANDLDLLLLVKQLWEQMLIYVRYSAKARAAGTADAP
ncbi:MAG: hypothetical protein NZL92_11720, partial [Gloeomargarita sp. SKYG116]|nr:hypothetical protein [Gloeomargarita sp. SKYG116]MDW8402350.1 hypothetical protein [Gloeomargarita sp. SKYGB_i_bin116]